VHFVWLIYVGFLFMPLLSSKPDRSWFWPTVISIPVFLTLYTSVIFKFRRSNPPGAAAMPEILIMALMGFLLTPVNESANTYIIYCVALAPFVLTGFRRLALFMVALLGAYALELAWIGFDGLLFGITSVVGMATAASNYMMLQNRLKNLALQASGEEVHRLARLAERERISRDLHDLLGHTLSLIAIKSELAAKLMDRDRAAAGREVTEVMNIAREALRQVRTAVTGIRSAALEGEIASARAMLETAGVMFTYERDGTVLTPEVETTLAMIIREAVTNIQRHARARFASIHVLSEEGAGKAVLLRVSDDGRGGITEPGNGLAGIRERVRALGGTLEIDSPRGEGTLLRVRVPMVGTASVLGAGGAARELVRSAAKESAGVSVAAVAEASGRSESAEVVAGTREVVRPQAALSLGVSNAASAGASRRSELPGTPVAELVESTVRESGMPGGVRT
jgi:two-component system sensor histidine kinase DesK